MSPGYEPEDDGTGEQRIITGVRQAIGGSGPQHVYNEVPITVGGLAKLIGAVIAIGSVVGAGMVGKYQIEDLQRRLQTLEFKRETELEKAEIPQLKNEITGLRTDFNAFRNEMRQRFRRKGEE
jgi:hypothetical protein